MSRYRNRPLKHLALLVAGLFAWTLGGASLAAQDRPSEREAGTAGEMVSPPAAPLPAVPAKREPTLRVSLSPDGETVYLVGMIFEGSFHQFDAVMREAPRARRVHLSSAGGYTIEARLISALVRKRKLDSYVEFYCASACTQIFAAGRDRVIGPSARLGFHQAVMLDAKGVAAGIRPRTDRKLTSTTVFGVNGNDTLRLAYELAGFDPAFIDKALSYGHENMWLPSAAELVAAKVVTRVADRAEVAPPPGGGSREEVRAHLLQQPLWRAGLEHIPQTTEAAIDDVWRSSNSGFTLAEAAETGRTRLVLAGSRGMAHAPDALLNRALSLYSGGARSQRLRGYPGCKTQIGTIALASDPADARFEADEDALVIDLLASDQQATPFGSDEATRIFAREVMPRLTSAYREGFINGSEGRCRVGFQTFEAIDGMPTKQRLRAYRALLSLPGLADGQPADGE